MSNYFKGADNTLYDPNTKEPVGRLGIDGQEHLFGASMVNPGNPATAFTDSSGTMGNVTISAARGRVAIAAGQSSVTVTASRATAQSVVAARIDQSTADTTLTSVVRVSVANGSFTIYGNASATATVPVRFAIIN